MTVTGSLKDFSLPELFQILEQSQKTGLLTVRALPTPEARKASVHHFWLHQGRIVAAADRLDQKGLLLMIGEQGWLSDRVASKLAKVCAPNQPIGRCLRSQGLLQTEQLKLLFRIQVLQQICVLFERPKGKFIFQPEVPLPTAEMTGFSISATDATLAGLRALRGSTYLAYKLPNPESALFSTIVGKPQVRLDAREWQVWEFANGTAPLHAIAAQLQIDVLEVQQIAFALIAVGLAEEVPTNTSPLQPSNRIARTGIEPLSKSSVSSSLIESFIGFLRPRI